MTLSVANKKETKADQSMKTTKKFQLKRKTRFEKETKDFKNIMKKLIGFRCFKLMSGKSREFNLKKE